MLMSFFAKQARNMNGMKGVCLSRQVALHGRRGGGKLATLPLKLGVT